MKKMIVLLLLALPKLVPGQNLDSLASARAVDSLIQLNVDFTDNRKFEDALKIIEIAENKALEVFGENHPLYAACLFNHGRTLYTKQRYPDAERYYLQAKDIQEKTVGKEHPDYAWTLRHLGIVYQYQGKYEKTEPLYTEAISILEKTTGKINLRYAGCLNSLGILYNDLAQYDKAITVLKESLQVYEQIPKSERPYAQTLNNLGIAYWRIGFYEECELTHLKAKAIKETVFGKEHPSYAMTLSNLAVLYDRLGQNDRAMQFNLEVKSIREKTLGKENTDYAMTLNNLANDYEELGEYENAEAFHLEAKSIREKVLGKEHADYTMSLNNLASLYRKLGRYEKAEELDREALSIREKTLGKNHPEYAYSLTGLGKTYEKMGLYEKAEPLFREAKDIREKALGRESAEYLKSLYSLADLYRATAEHEKAKPLYLEINEQEQQRIVRGMAFLHERELEQYIGSYQKSQQLFFSFSLDNAKTSLPFLKAVWNNTMFFKGLLQENSRSIEKSVASAPDSIQQIHSRWRGLHRRLAVAYTQPIVERKDVRELEEEANALEKELVRSVAGFGSTRRQATWQEIRDKLRPDEAAIEFAHFQYYDKENKPTDSTLYVALLLRPKWEAPRWVTLFEEKQLDSLLQTSGERKADYVSKLYTLAERGLVENRQSLYDLLWQPLEKELLPAEGTKAGAGVKTIYYSPAGLLHRLNLGAIPINADATLADKYQLVQLGSTRQLAIAESRMQNADSATRNPNSAILYGGIRYEMDSTAIRQANIFSQPSDALAASQGVLSFSYSDSLLRSGTWDYLPYTEKEITAIEQIMQSGGLQTQALKGYAATEESFKHIGQPLQGDKKPAPRILHIATHGFFFPDPKLEVRSETVRSEMSEPVFKISEHPMIRSGLLLAGANHTWSRGLGSKPLRPNMEDGILTAYEISQMNLSATELVVLSACETGLGQIQGNEGVYGLQRAFKIAGAKYLIMSLWQVPDKQTSLLMTAFYKKWLEEKMPIPDAFRAAQREMREQGFDPYQWAGFVLVE